MQQKSQFDPPVCKNMALPVHPQLFSFNLVEGVLGGEDTWRLLATCFSVIVVCTSHFSLQMAKVQSTNHRLVLICMN